MEIPEQLACPNCRGVVSGADGYVTCKLCGRVGQHVNGVWDFVAEPGYAETFGRQWSAFPQTQLDTKNGTTISLDQFARVTGWSEADLAGQRVLDGGCGSGRYAEIALRWGADVTGLDLSVAAYVALANLSDNPRFTAVRGNLLAPPLSPGSYDKVFSIGVVQSTPDPLEIARQLALLVRPGGELAIWMYERHWYSPLLPRTAIRPVTRRLSPDVVMSLSRRLVDVFTPVARAAGRIPSRVGRQVTRGLLPIVSYWGELPLTEEQQREWSFLDTLDWLSPTYNLPKTFEEVSDTLCKVGLANVRRLDVPGLSVIASRPCDSLTGSTG